MPLDGFGSFNNAVMARAKVKAPEVGDGATLLSWTDRHPATVVWVSETSTTTTASEKNAGALARGLRRHPRKPEEEREEAAVSAIDAVEGHKGRRRIAGRGLGNRGKAPNARKGKRSAPEREYENPLTRGIPGMPSQKGRRQMENDTARCLCGASTVGGWTGQGVHHGAHRCARVINEGGMSKSRKGTARVKGDDDGDEVQVG